MDPTPDHSPAVAEPQPAVPPAPAPRLIGRKRPTLTPPVFAANDRDTWMAFYQREGFAVIGGVLTDAERLQGVEHFWSDWATVSPGFLRDQPNTWVSRNAPMLFAKGIVKMYALAHGSFMWFVRLLPAIKAIFATLHGTDALLPSLDAFSVFFSTRQRSPETEWLHVDQSPNNPRHCVQGALNFFPVTATSAGLVVVPRSHTEYHAPAPPPDCKRPDYLYLRENTTIPFEARQVIASRAVKLLVPAGCLTLWNSRLLHENMPPAAAQSGELNRLTAYISFQPEAWADDAVRVKRREAYVNGAGTSHWIDRVERNRFGLERANHMRADVPMQPLRPLLGADGSIPLERAMLL